MADKLEAATSFLAGAAEVKMIIGLIFTSCFLMDSGLITAGGSSDVRKLQHRPWKVTAEHIHLPEPSPRLI